ncbi:MAG: DNA repair protein RadC [Clostridiales bacterium]|nr:DNA repair protein RadC [Clostridiales bacterium]
MIYKGDLPREKLLHKGAAALTDLELLQIVVGSGGKGNDYRQIAQNLDLVIQKIGIENLTIENVKEIKGVGNALAARTFAALEFWRRKCTKQPSPINTPERAVEQLGDIKNKKQEHFSLLTLDGARRLIKNHLVTIGTLTASLVHPREVFSLAVEDRAASIIIAHNHPSGVLDISKDDKEITDIIKKAGEILGILLDDHIIVAGDNFVSLRNEQVL